MAASTTIARGNIARALLAVAILLSLSGCASMVRRAHQKVAFQSDPPGALVRVDGAEGGRTPVVVKVPRRGGTKVVTFELEGYKTHIVKLGRRYNGWALGNALFGVVGLVGTGVDAVLGRNYDFDKVISVELEPGLGVTQINSELPELESVPILVEADPSFKDDF